MTHQLQQVSDLAVRLCQNVSTVLFIPEDAEILQNLFLKDHP